MSENQGKRKYFRGGVHPHDGKALSAKNSINEAPLFDKYQVVLQQNIGAPPKAIVKKGDVVLKGQMIAESTGFVCTPVHAPTSGVVSGIVEIPGAMGQSVKAIEIASDGEDKWGSSLKPMKDWEQRDDSEIKQRIHDAGIVGMGGAAFPTHVKLSPPENKNIDYLILNGAECEPYLTADHRLMIEDPERILKGALIIANSLNINKIAIGIEKNKPDAIKILKKHSADYGISIVPLRMMYPQGAEKQLIYSVTKRKVPAGGLPMDCGCVVQNVATAAAVYDAVVKGQPLIERVTTITGNSVVNPGNWRLKLGTTALDALKLASGVKNNPAKIIMGGPMMGFAQKSLMVTITKNSSGILLLDKEDTSIYESRQCINCKGCVDVCPMNLTPSVLSKAAVKENFDIAERFNVMDCMECGCCAYVCPSRRPMVQHLRLAKGKILAKRRAQQNK
ncbi:electron transport complex subunit RsxC [Lentisphaerota bacterium WC36G]|nr:electron transport complex subunit RsxC [Lentisphaerae bacterium WC36]